MSSETYVIGIDIGTGSTKAVAVNSTGKVLQSTQVPYPTITPSPDIVEQDPAVIWDAFCSCIRSITNNLSISPLGISLSSAMHSLIAVNEKGEPLCNMITWADNRSAAIATRLRNASVGKQIYEATGTPLHAMSPLCKIIWLKDNNESLYSKAHKFIGIKEYIWYKLFDTFEVDYSIASATGLFNIHTFQWHEASLNIAGITADKLSKPCDTHHSRTTSHEPWLTTLGLLPNTVFCIGSSDGCMANVGSYATEEGIAALTIGTSGAVRVASSLPIMNMETMPFNYRLDASTFIVGGPVNNGGVALRWYAQQLLEEPLHGEDDYEALLLKLDTVAPGSNGLIFLPYLYGERAPIWNSDACGVFFGIKGTHTRSHFTRAVIEGITLSLYQITRAMEERGLSIHQLNISGGFVRSSAWVQLLTDVFGKNVKLSLRDDASAFGAALWLYKKMGLTDASNHPDEDAIYFKPSAHAHEHYRKIVYPRFQHLYKALAVEMSIAHTLAFGVDDNDYPI